MDYSPQGWEIETRAGGEIKLDLWITPQAGENPQSIARSRDTIKGFIGSMDYSPQGWEIETRAGGEIKLDLWITARRAGRK